MRLDWENHIIFKDGVYETDKLPVSMKLQAEVFFPKGVTLNLHQNINFCYQNRVDVQSDKYTYFAMRKDLYERVVPELKKYYDKMTLEQQKKIMDVSKEAISSDLLGFTLYD